MITIKVQVKAGERHCRNCVFSMWDDSIREGVCLMFNDRKKQPVVTKCDYEAGDFKRCKQCLAAEVKDE